MTESKESIDTRRADIEPGMRLIARADEPYPRRNVSVFYPGAVLPEHWAVEVNQSDLEWFGSLLLKNNIKMSFLGRHENRHPMYELQEHQFIIT